MSEIDNCPPWKRKKVEPQGVGDTKIVPVHQPEPEFKIWLPDKRNPAIAIMDRDAKESLFFCRIVTGLLNKLTWENFEKLSVRMKNLRIDTPAKVQLVVDMIHKRAVVEWKYSILYVKMCDVLRRAQADKERKSTLSFSTYLVSKCEEFFTRSLRQDDDLHERVKEIDSCVDKTFKAAMTIEYQTQERIFRENLVAHCKFVGELFNMKIIHSGVIFDMLDTLLTATMFVSVECICTIISTIGLIYEESTGEFPDKYFVKIKSVLKSDDVPVWIRYHILELLDLRNRHWRPKRPTTPPRERTRESKIDKNRLPATKPASVPPKRHIEESKNSETIPEKKRIQESKVNQKTDSEKKYGQGSRNDRSRRRAQEWRKSHETVPDSKKSHDTNSRRERVQETKKSRTVPEKECIQESKNPAIVTRTESIRESEVNQLGTTVPKKRVQECKRNQESIRKSRTNLVTIQPQVELATIPHSERAQESEIDLFEDRVCKALDALTPHNIGLQVMTMTPLDNELQLKFLADAIFRKASYAPVGCGVYARLCNVMLSFRVRGDDESSFLEFRTVILDKCQELLDELGTNDSFFISRTEDKNEIRRKATVNCPFLIELSKLKIFTPEFNFQLCTKLIELRIEESLAMLRDLLTINGKAVLLRLKNRGRYAELFDLFDKLQDIYKDEKYSRIPFESQIKADLRKFIYGIENEFFIIQEIVHEGPIFSLKEFNPTTLFWYLRVFFNECRLKAKKPPKWLISQKSMFSSSKALHEAISQLLKYTMAGNSYNAARSGQFFIYLLKWDLISPQDIIAGLSIFFKTVAWQKKCNQLKIVTRDLSESGYFVYNNLRLALPADLVPKAPANLVPKPSAKLVPKPPVNSVPKPASNLVPLVPKAPALAPKSASNLVPLIPKAPVHSAPKPPSNLAPLVPKPLMNSAPKPPVNLAPKLLMDLVPEPPVIVAPKPPVNLAPKPLMDLVPEPLVNLAPKPLVNLAPKPPMDLVPQPRANLVPIPEVANNLVQSASEQIQYRTKVQPAFKDRVHKAVDLFSRDSMKNIIFSMTPIVNVAELEYIVNAVFLKVVGKPKSCDTYAKLLKEMLSLRVPNGNDETTYIEFKPVLFRRCKQFLEEMDPSSWKAQTRTIVIETRSETFRKAMNYCRLMTELSKMRILTPEIMHLLMLRIIELRIQFSIDWLSAIISHNGKDILLGLKEQNRCNEVFLLFEKLEPLLADEKYDSKVNAKITLKDFIYFETAENVVQSVVMRGTELNLKSFSPITLFRYLKVCLIQCNLSTKKLPKWVKAQQRMFSFSRALTAAISLLITYVIERKPAKVEKCGSLFVWLIKWNLISPLHVTEGVKDFLRTSDYLRTSESPQDREKLECISSTLFKSGYFKLDDLRSILPQDVISNPSTINVENPKSALNNFLQPEKSASKISLDQIQLQPSFEERVRKAVDTLTPSNIKNQIFLMIPLLNEPQFMYVAGVVFQKVISRPENHELYVKLCLDMWSFSVPNKDDESTQLEFSTVLLRKGCQILDEFEINESERGYSRYEEDENEVRQKVTTCSRFMVELCGLKTVDSEIIIHVCAKIIEFGIEESFFDWMADPLRTHWNEILMKLRNRGLFEIIFQFFEKLENILKDEKYSLLSRQMIRCIHGLENEFAMQEISVKGPPPSLDKFTPIMLYWYLRAVFNHCRMEEKEMPEWVCKRKKMFSSNTALPDVIAKLISYALLKNACASAEGGKFLNDIMKLELVSPQNVMDGLSNYFANYNIGAKGRKRVKHITNDLRRGGYFSEDDLKKIIPEDFISDPIENEETNVDFSEIQSDGVESNLKTKPDEPLPLLPLANRVSKALDGLALGNVGAQAALMYPLVKVTQFEYIVDMIFQKVIANPEKYVMYVKLCDHIQNTRVPSADDEFRYIDFKTVLSHKCIKFLDFLTTKPWSQCPFESNNAAHLKVTGKWRFLVDLTKMKISTPEFNYYLCGKLIDLRNPVLLGWLRESLKIHMKEMILYLKEERRYDEIFQFFEKIKSLTDDKDFARLTLTIEFREQMRFSIFGYDKENMIQEIVYEGPIPPLKEFTTVVLHWYLKVFFYHCNLKAKKIPDWVSSQKERINSNKNLPEAICTLLQHGCLNDDPLATRFGQFLIYLLKWDLILPQDVINGLSSYFKNGVPKKTSKKKHIRARQKIFLDQLFESGYFKDEDLIKVMNPGLAHEAYGYLIPPPTEVPVNTEQLPVTEVVTSVPVDVNSTIENTLIPQLMETHVGEIVDQETQKENIPDILRRLTPSNFSSEIFVNQMKRCLIKVENLEFAASLIIERVITFSDWYKFYVKICHSILKLTVGEKQFWMMLVTACDTYCNRLLFPSNDSSKENSSKIKKISIEEPPEKPDSLEFIPMAVIITDSEGRSKAVFTDSTTEANDRYTIDVPEDAYNELNEVFANVAQSICHSCGSATKAVDTQLENMRRKETYYRSFMANFQKKVAIRPIPQSTASSSCSADLNNPGCTVYMPQGVHDAVTTKIDFDVLPVCSKCGCKNKVLQDLWKFTKMRMESIDKVMECVCRRVNFKLNNVSVKPLVPKSQQNGKKALCRFFSELVNIIDNKIADTSIKSLMQRLLDAHQIEFFCLIYFRLNWKRDRFEKSLFDVKIPELQSIDALKSKFGEILEKVAKNFASREAGGGEIEENTRKRGPTEDNCDIPQKLATVDVNLSNVLNEEDNGFRVTKSSVAVNISTRIRDLIEVAEIFEDYR